jgi:hypothetical protein
MAGDLTFNQATTDRNRQGAPCIWIKTRVNALLPRTLRRGTEPLKLCRSDRHARPLPTLGLRGAATSHKGRRAGSRPARATIFFSCRLSSMAERCVVAAETLDRYRQAVPNIGRVAHRQSGGLQNRAREGSIPSSPANHFVRQRQQPSPSPYGTACLPPSGSSSIGTRRVPDPTVYWPIAVWSILATTGEGRLSLMPARPKAASSGDTRRSSMMATSAP